MSTLNHSTHPHASASPAHRINRAEFGIPAVGSILFVQPVHALITRYFDALVMSHLVKGPHKIYNRGIKYSMFVLNLHLWVRDFVERGQAM